MENVFLILIGLKGGTGCIASSSWMGWRRDDVPRENLHTFCDFIFRMFVRQLHSPTQTPFYAASFELASSIGGLAGGHSLNFR